MLQGLEEHAIREGSVFRKQTTNWLGIKVGTSFDDLKKVEAEFLTLKLENLALLDTMLKWQGWLRASLDGVATSTWPQSHSTLLPYT